MTIFQEIAWMIVYFQSGSVTMKGQCLLFFPDLKNKMVHAENLGILNNSFYIETFTFSGISSDPSEWKDYQDF